MTSLPKGMQSLTSLQTLQIQICRNMKSLRCLSSLHSRSIIRCPAMKSLPEAMSNLTSLKCLQIKHCPELFNRCKERKICKSNIFLKGLYVPDQHHIYLGISSSI